MAEKLKIIPLGGLGEVGKNMTVYESAGDIIVLDCGLGFPDDEMYGVDIVIPDMTYLLKHKNKIRGIFITHGHEDHIGAVPFLMKELVAPIYCTRLTAGLINLKLTEAGLAERADVRTIKAGDTVMAGCFTVEAINVNHSIADAVSFAIKTPLGMVIHTGDFKIDTTPVEGGVMDLGRFGELGKQGVLALLSDSTNAERPGYAMSERRVGESLDALFKNCDNRILVTTFASNVHRLQQIIDAAARYGRRVAVTGRSMENIIKLSVELGYINLPQNVLIELNAIKSLPKDKICIITTGSQGEPMSALFRIAFSGHKQVEIGAGDRVIISASPIPGNEKTISKVVNELFKKGAEVIYEKLADVHVSGHACQEELKLMLALTKPKYFMPLHGEYKHQKAHAQLARRCGVEPNRIFMGEIGLVWEIGPNSAKQTTSVPSGRVLVDGLGVGDVGSVILRDRKHLSQDGLLVVVVTLDSECHRIIAGPDIVSRGFVYVKESETLMEEMRQLAIKTIDNCVDNNMGDWQAVKSVLRGALSETIYRQTKRNPMILPVIMEI